MILNITDVLTAEGKTECLSVAFTPSSLQYGSHSFTITEKSPVSLTITNIGKGRAQVTGRMELTLLLCCDRRLKDVPYTLVPEFSDTVSSPEFGAAVPEDADEGMTGFEIDVDELICHEIWVNWPMKVLCRPDCRGICSVCGRDLNEGTCTCDTFVPDPRLAAIKDILNADKEV